MIVVRLFGLDCHIFLIIAF